MNKTIGIFGGGQLGRMMAQAALPLNIQCSFFEAETDCPAAILGPVFSSKNPEALQDFIASADVFSLEFENTPVADVDVLTQTKTLHPPRLALATAQNRLAEKSLFDELGIPVAPYRAVDSLDSLKQAVTELGLPIVLKTVTGGYDGKGQYVLKDRSDLAPAMNLLREGTCELEAWIPFEKELSIMVAGNGREYMTFPIVENSHRNNILHQTIAPANISPDVASEVTRIAKVIAKAVDLHGVLAIEIFLTSSGSIYVNELAPRPHNSGHYSIEACNTSQFDAHIRGICGWPLGEVTLLSPAVMVNILGEDLEKTYQQIQRQPDWQFHYYGKKESKKGRKMGHITIVTNDVEATKEQIKQTNIWLR